MSATLPTLLMTALEAQLAIQFHQPVQIEVVGTVTGGSSHHARRLETNVGPMFLKFNRIECLHMFVCEAEGDWALGESRTLPTVQPLVTGSSSGFAYMLQPWIARGTPAHNFWENFGTGLAALHQQIGPKHGWHRDNFLGGVMQQNAFQDDFVSLFALRLRYLAQLLRKGDNWSDELDTALDHFIKILPERIPPAPASLLHGDLWQGNFMVQENGQPMLIDPAIHYGHRESEIAFTKLFGGYDQRFYDSYHAAWPMEAGWEQRLPIYNLYPLMVHLHLFGRSYLPDIQETLHFHR